VEWNSNIHSQKQAETAYGKDAVDIGKTGSWHSNQNGSQYWWLHSDGTFTDMTAVFGWDDATEAEEPDGGGYGGIFGQGYFIFGSKTEGDANETFGSKPGTWVHVHDAYFGEDQQIAVGAAKDFGEMREEALEMDPTGATKIKELATSTENVQGRPAPVHDTVEGGTATDAESVGNGRIRFTQFKDVKIRSWDPHKPDTIRTTHYNF
jgi:hypothetical protein